MSEYISRQAFNDALANLVPWAIESSADNAYMEGLNAAHNALRSVPSAWKSANDELPECRKRLLCYYPEREDVYIADLDYDFEGKIIWVDDIGIISDKEEVALWAPLPVPPDVNVCNEAVPCGDDKRMEAESGWIPAEDRLPKHGECVLVYADSVELAVFDSSDNSFCHFWDGTKDDIYGVTHWMELPAPPDA